MSLNKVRAIIVVTSLLKRPLLLHNNQGKCVHAKCCLFTLNENSQKKSLCTKKDSGKLRSCDAGFNDTVERSETVASESRAKRGSSEPSLKPHATKQFSAYPSFFV